MPTTRDRLTQWLPDFIRPLDNLSNSSINRGVSPSRQKSRGPAHEWEHLTDQQLLNVRLKDLNLTLNGTKVEARILEVLRQLSSCGIRFRPTYWLAEDWFTPDGIPGFGIPFYLAHPRLIRLERAQMLEVEGGTKNWCQRIIRHEIGHALDNAYQLRRRRKRQRVFGRSSTRYPDWYCPKPYSKSFVIHLDYWYAQSHPDEDFAETFAVWMAGSASWRRRYKGWPALEKLRYMDELMSEVKKLRPVNKSVRKIEPVNRLSRTLGEYYQEKRDRYLVDYPQFLDRDLKRLFDADPEDKSLQTAVSFIRGARGSVRKEVARWTGIYQYTIDHVLEEMIDRCRNLNLRLEVRSDRTLVDFTVFLTVQTMNYLHNGRHRLAL